MEKIENILTDCIKAVKSGRATVAECLDRYPSRRYELEPLLKIALNIQEPPAFQMDNSNKQAVKAQLLRQVRSSKQTKSRTFSEVFSFGLAPNLAWARVAISVLIIVVFLSSLAGGTAYAAQSSLPGDVLYPVKIGTENLRLFVATGNVDKAELNLKFARTRLTEMSKLPPGDEQKMELALDGYQANIDAIRQQILLISDNVSEAGLLEVTLADMQSQADFCDQVIDADPTYKETIGKAGSLAISKQIEFIQLLEPYNNLQAALVNLGAMQNRLQRVQAKVDTSQYQLMQEALLQYQQFSQLGEQILLNAQASGNRPDEIEELSLQALSGYLNILNTIYQQVPQEYRNSIEVSRQMTMHFQTQAQNRYQRQGNPDLGPGGTSTGEGNNSGQGEQSPPQYQKQIENPGIESPNETTTHLQNGSQESGSGMEPGDGTDAPGEGGGVTIPNDGTTGSNSGRLFQIGKFDRRLVSVS